MKKVIVLGSTGSIGRQTLEVAAHLPEEIHVTALVAGSNVELLAEQVRRFRPALVAVADKERWRELKELLSGEKVTIMAGEEGVLAATEAEGDLVLAAIVGIAGLKPVLAAVRRGKDVALANKEALVTAGHLVQAEARRRGVKIMPVDSEHSAIFQSLHAGRPAEIKRLLLTASGGPFRTWPKKALQRVTEKEALQHPNWRMGAKITVDSATLMNKGLEVIEARWLFDVELKKIEVLVHPESIVHSLVEFVDGAVVAQLGLPDMRLPIQYALTYPERLPAPWPRLDLTGRTLTFEAPDTDRFPCLALARAAAQKGGTYPTVLNGANEVAVEEFLKGRLSFLGIPALVEKVLAGHTPVPEPDLEAVLAADAWARSKARALIREGVVGA